MKIARNTIAALAATTSAIFIAQVVTSDSHAPTYEIQQLGSVSAIGPCKAGKRSYACDVQTSAGWKISALEFSMLPGDNLQIADQLIFKTRHTGTKAERIYCVNGQCITQSVCYWWMPCFSETEPNK